MYLHLLQYFWPQVIRITKVVSNNFWNATKKSPEEPNKVHTTLPNYQHTLYSLLLNNHQGKNFHWSFKKIRQMAMTR